jgi:hypothetical protein
VYRRQAFHLLGLVHSRPRGSTSGFATEACGLNIGDFGLKDPQFRLEVEASGRKKALKLLSALGFTILKGILDNFQNPEKFWNFGQNHMPVA